MIPPKAWEDTHLALPTMNGGRELVTGRGLHDIVKLSTLFAHLPVALVALG